MNEIVILTKAELKELIKSAYLEVEKEKELERPTKLYTINEVAKRLGRAHETINKLVKSGVIRSTKDGLITKSAINDYLNQ